MAITCCDPGDFRAGSVLARTGSFTVSAEESRECPFPLADLPRSMGSWRITEGSEVQLDPEIAQIAGSS